MKGNRQFRIIFGVVVLVLFSVYTYLKVSTSPHSSDFDSEHAYVYSEVKEQLAKEAAEADAEAEEPVVLPLQPFEAPAEEDAEAPEETPEPEPTPVDEHPGLPDVDITSWEFVLANPSNSLGPDFEPPEIAKLTDSQCPVDSRIAEPLMAFIDAAKAQGLSVYLSSGYRPYSEQQYLFNRKLSQGYSQEDAARIVALPGTSEHQTGLACDITDYYREFKAWEDLEVTETYKWMSQHCQEYGFIVRYPKDKSGLNTTEAADSITGIIYEPWHYRYVGVEAATYIMENNLCLEEFLALYE
ncbi:MAG: M15 family metallopeptidase [Candidatus Limivicinus sp.]